MTVGAGSSRRELVAALLGCAGGAGLVLLAAGQPWVRAVVDLPPPLPPGRYVLSGGDLAPGATALGIAALAGLAGILATRGVARAAVAVVVVLTGAGVAASAPLAVRDDHVLAELAARTSFGADGAAVTLGTTAWWAVSLTGGLLVLAAGALTVFRGHRWVGMSARYDRPGTARATAPQSAHEASAMWDSLDGGADPTADTAVERDESTGKGS